MVNIADFPREILLRIFTYYLETETQGAFLHKVVTVCERWKEIRWDSSLWHKFDGSLSFGAFNLCCKNGVLNHAEIFVFCKMKDLLTRSELKSLYENLPHLRSINFSNVTEWFRKKECHLFSELCQHCPQLEEITIHGTAFQLLSKLYASVYLQNIVIYNTDLVYKPKVPCKIFDSFLRLRGSKLVSLDLSNLLLQSFNPLLSTIAISCPNLERLQLRNLSMKTTNNFFIIETMQSSLKKLQVLCLGYPVLIQRGDFQKFNGFLNLRTFSYRSEKDVQFEDRSFKMLLVKSPYLKVLDIQGCLNISTNALCSLTTPNLEKLYISDTRLSNCKGFISVLQKWSHSLVALDVSNVKGKLIDDCFVSFFSTCSLQNLESLDLHNTAITVPALKLIIDNCHKLNSLNVESCRNLDRGCKHAYIGKKAIHELLFKVDSKMPAIHHIVMQCN